MRAITHLSADKKDPEKAREMLSYIPSGDYETWIEVGMALQSEFGDAGFELWDQWSQRADNYKAKDALDTWKSFRGDGRTIGTLYYHARSNGWNSDSGERSCTAPKTAASKRQNHADTGQYAKELWLSANPKDEFVAQHPYAKRKGIDWAAGAARGTASGRLIGRSADCIVVPIINVVSGNMQGVQCINEAGQKQTFGKVSGGSLVLGNTLDKSINWYVAEGWASAVSMVFHHCKGNAVCGVSFGKSQLRGAAQCIAEAYRPREIVILQEVDA